MRVVLLTTETTHHTYYVARLAETATIAAIVVETSTPKPPFDVLHPFEVARDEYEREVLLAGITTPISAIAPTETVVNVNDALPVLRALTPDVVLVFGTSRLEPSVIEVATTACLNLHGGNPEEYRGLDTHLWAIYHRDFENLVTTLHHIAPDLDTGDIVAARPLPLSANMPIHELRSVNTKICLSLTQEALSEIEQGTAPRRPQQKRGRYYSFMPAVLKERCVAEFERHVAAL
jgi:methionyl-tRNA formyltransferase